MSFRMILTRWFVMVGCCTCCNCHPQQATKADGAGTELQLTGWIDGLPTSVPASGYVLPLTLDGAITGKTVCYASFLSGLGLFFVMRPQ